MTPRTGRPPSENPKTERLFIRVTPSDKKDIQEFSDETGYSLLDLLKIGVETVKKKNRDSPHDQAQTNLYYRSHLL